MPANPPAMPRQSPRLHNLPATAAYVRRPNRCQPWPFAPPGTFPLTSLPPELTLQIASFLPPPSIFALLLTSPLFSHLTTFLNALSMCDVTVTRRRYHAYNITPLQYFTCTKNTTHIIKRLLAAGADPNTTDAYLGPNYNQFTPLSHAISRSNAEVVALLLAHHADPNAPYRSFCYASRNFRAVKHNNGESMLHAAAEIQGPQAEIVIAHLLAAGASVHAKTSHGRTALHYVCRREGGNVAALLDAGADLNAVDDYGATPLHLAVQNRIFEAVRILLAKGADARAGTQEGLTPLHYAVDPRNVEAMRLLVAAGADVRASARNGLTPLHYAVSARNVEAVRLLVAAGADVRASARNGLTPLHYAASARNVEAVRLLVAAGADVRASAWNGLTPLHSAASTGDVEAVQLLVEKGADVRAVGGGGVTPLHHAVRKMVREVVEVLIEGGADVKAVTSAGVSMAGFVMAVSGNKRLSVLKEWLLWLAERGVGGVEVELKKVEKRLENKGKRI